MVNLTIDTKKTTEEIIGFIRMSFKKAGFEKAVVGISGGVDSATTLVLAVRALGEENVRAVNLPYGERGRETTEEINELIRQFKIPAKNFITINIKPLVDPLLALDSKSDRLRAGNIMVRMRMIIIYDLAKKYRAMVAGTENKTEYHLGYFTRFG